MSQKTPALTITEQQRKVLRFSGKRTLSEVRESGAIFLKSGFQDIENHELAIWDTLVYLLSNNVDTAKALSTLAVKTRGISNGYYTRDKLRELKESAFIFIDIQREIEKATCEISNSDKISLKINDINLDELAEASLKALIKRNSTNPTIFVRSGDLVRVVHDEVGRPVVSTIDEKVMRLKLCQCVEYINVYSNGSYIKADPPLNVVRTVQAYGEWPGIPPIKALIQTPIIHEDGYITLETGYDAKTSYYYDPGKSLLVPPVPEYPTPRDVKESVLTMLEPFREFPYEDAASFTAVIATLLSVMARNLITSPIPLLIVSKPQMGTGSSKVCEIIAAIATGRPMNTMPQPESEAEWRKAILTKLETSPPLVVLDNYEGKISSSYFASLLTIQEWTDRLLGFSKSATYPNRSVWIANGNNLKIGTDLPRRTFWCKIDAKEANPWEREGFTHNDVVEWAFENRGKIVSAVLTIIRSWIFTGSPDWKREDGVKLLGGFESWCNVIGGILDHAGIKGFLKNQSAMYEAGDTDTPIWDTFFTKWHDLYGEEKVTISEICVMLDSDSTEPASEDTLLSVLPESIADIPIKTQKFKVHLGIGISRNEKRVFPSGLMVQKAGEKKRAVKWQVINTKQHSELFQTQLTEGESVDPRLTQHKTEVSARDYTNLIFNPVSSSTSLHLGESVNSRLTLNENGLNKIVSDNSPDKHSFSTSLNNKGESGESICDRSTGGNNNCVHKKNLDPYTYELKTDSPDSLDSPSKDPKINYIYLLNLYDLPKIVDITKYEKVSLSHRLTCSVKGCGSPAVWRGPKKYPLPLCHKHYITLKNQKDKEYQDKEKHSGEIPEEEVHA